jgi:hypothetical protein
MKRHNMSNLEGEESMQHMNRMVLGLIAVFVLGGSLVLLSCGGDDDTTDITASDASFQLGGREFTFTTETEFGVASATLAFNADATRFALIAGNSVATGLVTYGDGSCTFGVGASTFAPGTGPQPGQVFTADTCQTDQSNNNNLILDDATSTSNGPARTINFGS